MKMKKFALRGLVFLAIAVALCIFFSGTIRTLTTPKVRFAPVKMGKMEQETPLTGKVVFPEEEEFILDIPEGISLTVTRVYPAAGAKVKKGDTLITTKVTDGEKTLESLKKDAQTAQKELRTLEKKLEGLRLTRGEQQWQEAWEAEDSAREAERAARVSLQAALSQAGIALEENALPADAGEEIQGLYDAWKASESALARAAEALKALDRFAIPEDTWTAMQQQREQTEKLAEAEEKMTQLQVLAKTAEKVTAPRTAYITEVKVEKGSSLDGDTVILKMTAEGKEPVIRFDLSEVKQEVAQGTTILLESDGWSRPSVKVTGTGLTIEGRPFADAEITQDTIYSLGSVAAMMKNEIKGSLITRSSSATCLVPASAVRGSGDSRYVYIGQTESSAFGGSQMKVSKMNVTVLAENGSTVSLAEDLTYVKVLYMEDRALTEDGTVMEYTKDSAQ